MSVVVVRADADEPDPGSERPVQLGVLVGRAVVGDLHDVHRRQGLRRRGPRQPTLGVLTQVPEEHRADAPRAGTLRRGIDAEDEARRVACSLVTLRRPEDLPAEVAEQPGGPVGRLADVDPGAPQVTDDAVVRRPADRTDQGGLDPRRDRGHGADVVAVEVGQDEQVDPVHTEEGQTGRQPGVVVPGVHEGRPTSAPQQRGVTLPDVFLADSGRVASREAQ